MLFNWSELWLECQSCANHFNVKQKSRKSKVAMSNSEQTASQTNISITAKDNQVLAATLFTPKLANGICIQINSAMAVTRGFYRTFAQYLAEQGFTVVTYDYRGIGDSYCKNWRNITLWQWGELDYPAVTDWLSANYPDHRMVALGHSLGGQWLQA